MRRREYDIRVVVNHVQIRKVIVDPHYEKKHAGSISDEIILELVKTLDGQLFEPDETVGPFSYFKTERIERCDRHYRLIWLLERDQDYIGVINAFRR